MWLLGVRFSVSSVVLRCLVVLLSLVKLIVWL